MAVLVATFLATGVSRAEAAGVWERVASMTLEEKVGQLFMIHAYGASVDEAEHADLNNEIHGVPTIREAVQKYRPGGFIYFAWTHNIEGPEQIARLSNDIQRIGLDAGSPLLIAIDQEHGAVLRIGAPATEFPGSMALGATGDTDLARKAAAVTADELRAMGINVNFAPVADVNVNPSNPVIGVRSFGDRPDLVGEFVAAQVLGFASAGVASAAKHFPGHGDTDVDSHTGLPLIDHTPEELASIDLPPFQRAIEAGVDMIMTAHIVVPALDASGPPATMSRPILTDLLRTKMGFDGVIVTDALNMAGARQTFDPRRVPVEALKAGADMLLMPPNMDVAYQAVLAAVQSGEIPESRIDQSVLRILTLKEKLGLFDDPFVDVDQVFATVGAPEHGALAREVAERSITLLKDEAKALPIDFGRGPSILVTGWGESSTEALAKSFRRRGATVDWVATGASPDQAAIRRAVHASAQHDLVVLITNNVVRSPAQQALARALVDGGAKVIAVALGMPYDVEALPFVDTVVAAYSYRNVSLEALVGVLAGEREAVGRSPVALVAD